MDTGRVSRRLICTRVINAFDRTRLREDYDSFADIYHRQWIEFSEQLDVAVASYIENSINNVPEYLQCFYDEVMHDAEIYFSSKMGKSKLSAGRLGMAGRARTANWLNNVASSQLEGRRSADS